MTTVIAWEELPVLVRASFEGWLQGWERNEMWLVYSSSEDSDDERVYHGTIATSTSVHQGLDAWLEGGGVQVKAHTNLIEDQSEYTRNPVVMNLNPRQMPYIFGG